MWNCLPVDIFAVNSIAIFKTKLNNALLSTSPDLLLHLIQLAVCPWEDLGQIMEIAPAIPDLLRTNTKSGHSMRKAHYFKRIQVCTRFVDLS